MGQAVADLPDPLEMTPPSTNASATDDLLSQIAGDEIDRLMSESENGRVPDTGAVAATPEPAAPSMGEQIASVLNELETEPAAKPQATVEAVAHVETAPIISPDPQAVMSTAEREALGLSNLADETDAAEHHDAIELEQSARPGLVIRLLEGLNAPLSFVPDGARDAIGKLAIVTLANSIAVLVYVMLFRR